MKRTALYYRCRGCGSLLPRGATVSNIGDRAGQLGAGEDLYLPARFTLEEQTALVLAGRVTELQSCFYCQSVKKERVTGND